MKKDIIDGFFISTLIYFLYREWEIDNLFSWVGIQQERFPSIVFEILTFMWIVLFDHESKKYLFTKQFSSSFSEIDLGNIVILVWWYGDNFIKLDSVLKSWDYTKNAEEIWRGSFRSGKKLNIQYLREKLDNHSSGTFIDLWCWSWDMLFTLSHEYPNLDFVWIEISQQLVSTLQQKNKMTNLTFIAGNILDNNLYQWFKNVIGISAFFVLHEVRDALEEYLEFLSDNFKEAFLVLREFTPPRDIKSLYGVEDTFVAPYLMFHYFTGQKTYTQIEWKELLEKYKIYLSHSINIKLYDENNSLYPLMDFQIWK